MAAILGPLLSDKKLNFEQYLLNTHWYYTLQIHGITTGIQVDWYTDACWCDWYTVGLVYFNTPVYRWTGILVFL